MRLLEYRHFSLRVIRRSITTCSLFAAIIFAVCAQSVTAVEKVTITVSDIDRASAFYSEVLDFIPVASWHLSAEETGQLFGLEDQSVSAQIMQLQLGSERIELMQFIGIAGHPIPLDSRSNDLWFQHIAIVVNDMDAAYHRVRSSGAAFVSTMPQTLPETIPAAAGITAFYFRDPDGHNLELIQFPKGKGNSKWQAPHPGEIFIGIDHTAIGIEQTPAALAFYQDVLGLEIGGRSENFGSEQEHLNQVFGAYLLITGLHAPQGLGVEFLDYIAPPGGRPYPLASTPWDLWHWHTTLLVRDLEALYLKLETFGIQTISAQIVQLRDSKVLIIRDPDGHALWLEESPSQ